MKAAFDLIRQLLVKPAMTNWSLPIFDPPIRTPPSPPNLTPISRALAQTLAHPAGSAAPNLPSASLRCIPAPQNFICCAPIIRLSLNDTDRL